MSSLVSWEICVHFFQIRATEVMSLCSTRRDVHVLCSFCLMQEVKNWEMELEVVWCSLWGIYCWPHDCLSGHRAQPCPWNRHSVSGLQDLQFLSLLGRKWGGLWIGGKKIDPGAINLELCQLLIFSNLIEKNTVLILFLSAFLLLLVRLAHFIKVVISFIVVAW